MNRMLCAALAATLGLGLLSGCAGNDDVGADDQAGRSDYCADLTKAKASIGSIEDGDLSTIAKTSKQIHRLADEAPDGVADDWSVLTGGFDQILAAFEKVGLTEDDIVNLQDNRLPANVDMTALQQAMSEIDELKGDTFTAAGAAIATHAEDACGIDLNG